MMLVCLIGIGSWNDDVRSPFGAPDPIVRDVLSMLWGSEVVSETGSVLKIMTQEILSQVGFDYS